MGLSILLVIIGFALLIKGADFLVEGASNVARRIKIPAFVIGLTIVSIGTSMPELFISLTSALDGYQDMAIGNVIGSNIANLLLILGTAAMIKMVDIKKGAIQFEIPICIAVTFIFSIMCKTGEGIARIEAISLLVLFIAFLGYTIYSTKKKVKEETVESSSQKKSYLLVDILLIVLGITALKLGGDLSVNNATKIATILGLSEKVISITILAIGTSLPELVTSMVAAIKGNSDIAIGNVLGSNLFNLLLIIGVSAAIRPMTYNVAYDFDLLILNIATMLFLTFPFIPPNNKMSRTEGIIYVVLYLVYLTVAFIK